MKEKRMNDLPAVPRKTEPGVICGNGSRGTGFIHRKNKDGSFDSICLKCFQTAVTAHHESFLNSLEHNHQCSEADLWRSKG
jgi:hypothetical protein